MKKYKVVFLLSLLFMILNARENPFIPSDDYNQRVSEAQFNLKAEEIQQAMQEKDYINKIQKQMNGKVKTVSNKKPKEKIYTKKEVDKLLLKTKKQTEYQTKKIIEKELKRKPPVQIVYVKPRINLDEKTDKKIKKPIFTEKRILPFLKIKYSDKIFIINTKYKIIRKFTLSEDNKIVIDYKGTKSFQTKKESLNSKEFSKIWIGTHKEENYFRVAIKLNSNIQSYKVEKEGDNIKIFKK